MGRAGSVGLNLTVSTCFKAYFSQYYLEMIYRQAPNCPDGQLKGHYEKKSISDFSVKGQTGEKQDNDGEMARL